MDADAQARTRELGAALQSALAARIIASPEYAVSPIVMGLDALSSMMQNSPDTLAEFGPTLSTAVACFNYAIAGEASEAVDAILRGELPAL
jgi:hypothetical protein